MAFYVKKLIYLTGIMIICLLLLVVGAVSYLKSSSFLDLALSKVNTVIPGSIVSESHHISFFTGTIGLNGVYVKDPEGQDVITCSHLEVNISYMALLKRKLLVESLSIDNPDVTFGMTRDKGFNLLNVFITPKPPDDTKKKKKKKKARGIPFNIVIQELNLTKGAFSFEIPDNNFGTMLRDIRIKANGNLRKQSATAVLSAGEGAVHTRPFNIHLSNPIKIQGHLNHTSIDSLAVTVATEHSRVSISGNIQDVFSNPDMHLLADLDVSTAEIQEAFSVDPVVIGQAKGRLSFSGTVNQPRVQINIEIAKGKFLENPVENFSLDLTLDHYLAVCNILKLDIFESTVDITGHVDLKKVFPHGYLGSGTNFHALTWDVNLKQKNGRPGNLPWLENSMEGRFDSEMDLRGKGVAFDRLNASGNLRVTAVRISADKLVTPVDLEIDASAGIENSVLAVNRLTLNSDTLQIDGKGDVDFKHGLVDARLNLNAPGLEAFLSAVGVKDIAGAATLTARMSGAIKQPHIDLAVSADNLSVSSVTLGNIVAAGALSGGELKIDHIQLQNNQSFLNLRGNLKIFKPGTFTLEKTPEFHLSIGENTLFLEDFLDIVKGRFTLSGQVSGSTADPVGKLRIIGENIETSVQKITSVKGDFILKDRNIELSSLAVRFQEEESLTASGRLSFDKTYQVALMSRGIPLKEIDWLQNRSVTQGILDFQLNGNGSIDNPQITGDIHLTRLSVQEQQLEDFQIHLDVKDKIIRISGRIDADVNAMIDLQNKQVDAEILCLETDLSPYFNIFDMPDYSGMLSGKIKVNGSLDHLTDLKAFAGISQLRIFHNQLKLAEAGPFEVFYENHTASVPETRIYILDTSILDISGHIDLDGPLSFKATGRIPLSTLSLYVDELYDIKGDLDLQAVVTGTITEPAIEATLTCADIEFTIPELYQKLHNGKGTVRFTNNKIIIDRFSADIDTGSFNLRGDAALEAFKPVSMDLRLTANALPIYVPDTMDLYLNADLRFSGTREKSIAKGEIILLEGVYYKDIRLKPLDLLKNVTRKRREVAPAPKNIDLPVLKNMVLDIDVKQRSEFLVDNNLAQLSMYADISVSGEALRPVISGQTKIDEGVIFYLKKEFNVENGKIDFVNPYKTEPYIDVTSDVTIRTWAIELHVFGTPEHLGFELSSTPVLSQENIISLILFGRTRTEIEKGEQQSSQSTSQLLAGMVASTFEKEIKKTTGLDIIEVETVNAKDEKTDDDETGENGGTPSERIKVTLGKQLTDRLTMKYALEQKNGKVSQEVLSEFKIIENVIVNGSYDTQGEFGGEFVYRLEFR